MVLPLGTFLFHTHDGIVINDYPIFLPKIRLRIYLLWVTAIYCNMAWIAANLIQLNKKVIKDVR